MTNMAASNVDIHSYDGSHLRPTSEAARAQDRSRSQDETGEELELYSISSRESRASGFEPVESNTSSPPTLPPAPINVPISVSATTMDTAPAAVHAELSTVPNTDGQPPQPEAQQTNESLRYAFLHSCFPYMIELIDLVGGRFTITTSSSSL